jgi:hypothetical protein
MTYRIELLVEGIIMPNGGYIAPGAVHWSDEALPIREDGRLIGTLTAIRREDDGTITGVVGAVREEEKR